MYKIKLQSFNSTLKAPVMYNFTLKTIKTLNMTNVMV